MSFKEKIKQKIKRGALVFLTLVSSVAPFGQKSEGKTVYPTNEKSKTIVNNNPQSNLDPIPDLASLMRKANEEKYRKMQYDKCEEKLNEYIDSYDLSQVHDYIAAINSLGLPLQMTKEDFLAMHEGKQNLELIKNVEIAGRYTRRKTGKRSGNCAMAVKGGVRRSKLSYCEGTITGSSAYQMAADNALGANPYFTAVEVDSLSTLSYLVGGAIPVWDKGVRAKHGHVSTAKRKYNKDGSFAVYEVSDFTALQNNHGYRNKHNKKAGHYGDVMVFIPTREFVGTTIDEEYAKNSLREKIHFLREIMTIEEYKEFTSAVLAEDINFAKAQVTLAKNRANVEPEIPLMLRGVDDVNLQEHFADIKSDQSYPKSWIAENSGQDDVFYYRAKKARLHLKYYQDKLYNHDQNQENLADNDVKSKNDRKSVISESMKIRMKLERQNRICRS